MHSRSLRTRLFHLFLGLLLLPATALADRLIMQNGDVISGEISKIADGKVHIDPSYGDEYAVDLAEVVSIQADKVFAIDMADGQSVEGQFVGATEGEQKVIVDDEPMNIGLAEVAAAADPLAEVIVDPWDGTGEFGFVSTSGNTETVALNMRLNFVRTGERWRHRFTGTALNTSEDGIQDNERYTVEVQSDRKLSEKSWLFGAFRWDSDKFGSYDPQVSLSAGYGHLLMQSDRHELKGEIGLGYRLLEETVSREETDEAIIRILFDDWWQIWESTRWTNRLLIETGSSNTFAQFNTGLAVSMTDKFAVKLGFEARHNTDIPPGDTEHTDTITSVNLVYNF